MTARCPACGDTGRMVATSWTRVTQDEPCKCGRSPAGVRDPKPANMTPDQLAALHVLAAVAPPAPWAFVAGRAGRRSLGEIHGPLGAVLGFGFIDDPALAAAVQLMVAAPQLLAEVARLTRRVATLERALAASMEAR